MKLVEIYTDGACSGNPGVGGYCGILIYGKNEKIVSGAEVLTTNNRMELTAVIMALNALKQPCLVNLYSDSAYVINAMNEDWISSWVLKGWKTAGKSEVQNVDLWKKLLELVQIHKITWIKVKGHADNEYNNKCDKIARNEIEKLNKQPKKNAD